MTDAIDTLFAAESGGNFLVTPNVGLMIWTLIAFGIALFLLQRLAFPRIGEALEKRRKAIEESIEEAERTRREADDLLEEYRARLREAREQAEEIVARSRKAGERLEQDAVVEAKQEREELMARTRRETYLTVSVPRHGAIGHATSCVRQVSEAPPVLSPDASRSRHRNYR